MSERHHATLRERASRSATTPSQPLERRGAPALASVPAAVTPRRSLLWLSLGAFAIGTETFMIAGLLPRIAADLAVSVPLAGQLVTAFALAYAIGSPLVAVATGNMERKRLLVVAIAAFAGSNLVAAVARDYRTLLAARILLALSAGTFMPAASAFAVSVSSSERRGQALALIYSGMTFATVIGVPAGVLIGGHLGWRSTFGVVALLALLAMAGIAFGLPRVPSASAATLRERLAIARRPDVLAALTQTMLALAGTFTIYTYLAPFLERTAGLNGGAIAAILLLFGIGGATGNLVGGSLSDRFGPTLVLRFVLSGLIALFVALALAASLLSPHAGWVLAPVIAAWGLVGWSFPAAQQTRLVALEPRLAPITLSLNASAIYFGVSLGALVGSLVVAHAPIAELGWAAAASEALALAGLLFGAARQKARAQTAVSAKGLPVPDRRAD